MSAAPPSNALCSAGTASAVSGNGPWTWTCAGNSGGAIASCSASPAPAVSASGVSEFAAHIGGVSAAQTVTLTNTGSAVLVISGISASGDFTATSDCGTSLDPGASCKITVTFTPSAVGATTGSLSIVSNATNSPQVITLNGTGQPSTAPPVITLNGDATVTLSVGDTFVDPGATASDGQDGNLTSRIKVTSNVDTSQPGTYLMTYSVTDSRGLTASVDRHVVVQAGIEVPLRPSETIDLPVVGEALSTPGGGTSAVPADATAVSLNVTAVDPDGPGYITVWPCSVARPLASNLNYVAGETVANGIIAPVGSDGMVCLYAYSTTDLVVDVGGYFEGDAFTGATPQRLVDTRNGTGAPQAKVTPATPLAIQITDLHAKTPAGADITVPSTIKAAALNVTVVNPAGQGYVTVYPCDDARPLASNVNFVKGEVVSNGVIAPVGASGEVCVYASTSTDIVVDLEGWFPETSFTGAIPQRLVDTRNGTGAAKGKIGGSDELSIPVIGQTLTVNGTTETVPAAATAAALNVTAIDPRGQGYMTVYPCGKDRPLASSLNYVAGDVVANDVIAPIGRNGHLCVYSSTGSDVVVDISGWYTGNGVNGFVGTVPYRVVDTRKGVGPPPQ